MKIGFIGLGTLGKEIAKRIIQAGYSLKVWNRTIDKAKDLGAEIAESPLDIANTCDPIFIIVFDSAASKETICGEKGLIKGNLSKKTIIDMTTNFPGYVRETQKRLKEVGAFYIDAPILGSVIPARKGELTLLLSGEKEKAEAYQDIYQSFAKNIYYVGEAGKASELKLINNFILATFMEAIGEALSLGEKLGFSKELLLEVLGNGAGKSMLLEVKKQKLLEEDFSTHFSADLMYKDLCYLMDLLKEKGEISFTTSIIKELYGLIKKKGLGTSDFSIIYKILKEM
ncbi:MAG: NAD(P)-dependent oxidoreductase [Caldimicrobium sp.]